MVGFREHVRSVFGSSRRYNVTRQTLEVQSSKKTIMAASIACAIVVLVIVWLTLLLVYLNNNNKSRSENDLDILHQHRKMTESLVQGWIEEIYLLKKDAAKGYSTSGAFDTISKHGYIMQEIVKKIAAMKNLSLNKLQSADEHQKTFRKVVQDLCQPETVCEKDIVNSPYRTFDGSCNNLYHPEWGMTRRPQRRSLPAAYSDDLGAPRMVGNDGSPLPSPRLISNIIHSPNGNRHTDEHTTVMVMAFGQFLSHDIASTPMMDGHHSSVLKCCEEQQNKLPTGPFQACFPVHVPNDDMFFKNSPCMSFTRSAPAICNKCEICGRQQINEMSSYIDASEVYGKTENVSRQLRTFTGGLLMVNEQDLLPSQKAGNCRLTKQHQYCFNAGDGRVNVVPNLSTLHTSFVRLHNSLAEKLLQNNPHWEDEILYQEARKILIAIMQNIVYSEYLPAILGNEYMKLYNLNTRNGSVFDAVYKSSVDATITNAFTTAAFRFGHVTVPDDQVSLNDGYSEECVSRIEETYHNPNMTFLFCDGLSRWMVHKKGLPADGSFSKGVRNLLFLDKKKLSFDLAALNIQRGRDHGLPSYNSWRRLCRLTTVTEDEFRRAGTAFGNFTAENADLFRKIYRHPDDIDLYSGGVKETKASGAQVGPTFACLIAREFRQLKLGDRFYFENPRESTGFTINQLRTIKGTRFAKVLCETMNISEIQTNVFEPVSERNQLKSCSELQDIDLALWKDTGK